MDDILFLCMGNICRSPMAEALLRHRLDSLGVAARVSSAGQLESGLPASDYGVDILRERGLDMSAHRSRQATPDMLRSADLIIAMALEHLMDAAVKVSDVFPRTFTLKELVRRGEAVGPRRPNEPLGGWLARVGEGRTRPQVMAESRADNIADPIGGPRSAYERLALELDDLIDRLVAVAFAGALTRR